MQLVRPMSIVSLFLPTCGYDYACTHPPLLAPWIPFISNSGIANYALCRIFRKFPLKYHVFRASCIKLPQRIMGYNRTFPLPVTAFLRRRAINSAVTEYERVKKPLDCITKKRYYHGKNRVSPRMSCFRRASTETACTLRATQSRCDSSTIGKGLFCGSRWHTRFARALRRVATAVQSDGSPLRAVIISSFFKSVASILTLF